jgi:SAM-dependent methyltransferase
MVVLEIGCGFKKTHDAIGVDINPRSQADVICDLNRFPYPFADNQFDRVIASHILEHLDNVVMTMQELWRISKPDATILIDVPHFSSPWYFQDPTHQHSFGTRTFEYWDPDTPYHFFGLYSPPHIKLKKRRVDLVVESHSIVARFVHWLINKYQATYEDRFAFMFPRHAIHAELEVVK